MAHVLRLVAALATLTAVFYAATIYTAKAEAAAQGKSYKPLRRRRRSSFGFRGDPYESTP